MRYATDHSTDVYMMGYGFSDGPIKVWVNDGTPFPQEVTEHYCAGGLIHAWNAAFERLIFWYVLCPTLDLPEPALEQFRCTMVRAQAHGLPGKLGDAVRALGLPVDKLEQGTHFIREYCAKNVLWEDIPEADQDSGIEYCAGDVEVEMAVARCLRPLTEYECDEYVINECINDRGVPVDLPMAKAALGYAEEVRAEVDGKIATLTEHRVATARKRKTRDEWLLPQLTEAALKTITKKAAHTDEETGEEVPARYSFDQEHRDALRIHPDCPEPVVEYIELLDEAGGATISKYEAIVRKAMNGRVHGNLFLNGAGQTGRFSSKGMQMHNMKRDTFDDPEPIIRDLMAFVELDEPTATLGKLIRSAIHLETGMSWYDFSSIEGRVAPWLAQNSLGERKLDLYRKGIDPYLVNAASTFNVNRDEVTKAQRQAGKLQELALQFLGGVGALKVMGRNYGLHIDDDEAQRMVDAWRVLNPWAKSFGNDLDRAAMLAVMHPGREYTAGRIVYIYDGGDWLWCRLPSGRYIAYCHPLIEYVPTPWGEERAAVTCIQGSLKPKRGEAWPRRPMHGGLWIENVTQGTAADLLREAIVRADDAGLDIILHVHDEIVVEGYHTQLLGEIMLDAAPWAKGLPLAGEGGCGTRYGK